MRKLTYVHGAIGIFSVIAIGTLSTAARADTACGSNPGGWNVPAGAAVFEHDHIGGISTMLNAFGEYYSHSMLSHGPDGWVTHATSSTPADHQTPFSDWPTVCDDPIDKGFLAASTPGLATISNAGAYTFLYENGGTPEELVYMEPTFYLVNSCPDGQSCINENGVLYEPLGPVLGNEYYGTPDGYGQTGLQGVTAADGYDVLYDVNFTAPFGSATPIYYGWYQYMNIGSVAQGYPQWQPNGQGYGVVCSSSLAMWQHDALWNQPDYYTGDVLPRTYTSDQLTAAANAVFGYIYDQCQGDTTLNNVSDLGDFGQLGSAIGSATACAGISVCSNAANQLVNTFASDSYMDDVGADWQAVVANQEAVSISPDDIMCVDQPANGTGAPCFGAGSSIWGGNGFNQVQFNLPGGATYGCWE